MFLLFIAYLCQVRRLAYSTIKLYASAVRDWAIRRGFKDPRCNKRAQMHRYRLLMRGIRRVKPAKRTCKRKPLTFSKMRRVADAVTFINLPHLEKVMFRTAIMFAFYSFCRSSEFCFRVHSQQTTLRRKDVRIFEIRDGTRAACILLRQSKTDQFRPIKIYLYEN